MSQFEEVFNLRNNPPEWAEDVLTNRTQVVLPFWERIRVLFGATVETEVAVACAQEPGRTETRSCARVYGGALDRRRRPTVSQAAEPALFRDCAAYDRTIRDGAAHE